jgi:hypothetical protein
MEIASCLEALLVRQQADGAFIPRDGLESRPDATAWGVLGMRASGDATKNLVERARERLLQQQMPDGRVPVSERQPSACWPTTLALLAWHGWPAGDAAAQRSLEFLTNLPVRTFKTEDQVNAIDSTLHGWTWIAGTSSWVEPTALTVFVFDRYGRKADRVGEGVKLLLDRQLPHGGWNFGNTLVYGSELLPAEEYVGVALTGLAGRCEESQIAASIAFIEQRLVKLRTPLALSWGILGLAAWGRRPADADQWISECLARQKKVGSFDTTHLALLLVASHCRTGLGGLFAA